jgi:molybdenum cofactor cytidylyltransferase
MIHALVLAAGESKRMGMPKPLLRFGDTTFLGQILCVLRRSDVDGTTVVLGARADMIRAFVDLSEVDVVVNEDYPQGQLSSLIKGLKSLPGDTDAMLLCLVDHPFITTEIVNRLVGAFKETHRAIVLPVFNGRRGHPALFSRSLFEELANAPQEKGARYVVSSNEDKVLEVDIPDRAVSLSIDTPEDYRSCFGTEPQIVRQKL